MDLLQGYLSRHGGFSLTENAVGAIRIGALWIHDGLPETLGRNNTWEKVICHEPERTKLCSVEMNEEHGTQRQDGGKDCNDRFGGRFHDFTEQVIMPFCISCRLG